MKIFKVFGLAVLILTLSGCGERVTVDSGRVAKQLGTNGLEKSIRREGAFRLDSCVTTACPRLVILDVFENATTVGNKFYISKSKLNLTLKLDIQYAVREDDASINKVYKRVKSVSISGTRRSEISTDQVFDTYIRPSVIDITRTALNNYDIDTIMDNLSEVREHVENVIKTSYSDSPVEIIRVTFSDVSFPPVIVLRREEAASVDAEKVTKIKRLEAQLEISEKKRALGIIRARYAVEEDKIVSKSMDKKMQAWLMLEAIQTCAEREGCNINIHPSMFPQL